MDLSGLSDHLKAVESKDSITLPWEGTEYVVRPPGKERRLRCAMLFAAYTRSGAEKVAAISEALAGEPVEDVILGAKMAARLHADDIDPKVIGHLSTIALLAWVQGEAAAQRYIDAAAAGEPGPKAPARSTRRTTGTSTGAASTTKRRASTSGTKPRRSASPKAAGKAPVAASTGGTSSSAGTSS